MCRVRAPHLFRLDSVCVFSCALGSDLAIFYQWKPTLFVATQNFGSHVVRHVSIPGHAHLQEDMSKFISPTMRNTNPAAFALLKELSLSDAAVIDLLQKLALNGSATIAVCSWLSENNATWGPWVTSARGRLTSALPVAAAAVAEDDTNLLGQGARIALGAIMLLIILALVSRLCWVNWLVRQREGQLTKTKSALEEQVKAATLGRAVSSSDSGGDGGTLLNDCPMVLVRQCASL